MWRDPSQMLQISSQQKYISLVALQRLTGEQDEEMSVVLSDILKEYRKKAQHPLR